MIHSSFRATTVIAIRYKNRLRTFSSWICVFTALSLFARAKRGFNVTAAADGSTARAILASLSPSTVLLFRQKSRLTGPATSARMPRLHLTNTHHQTSRVLEWTRRAVWKQAGSYYSPIKKLSVSVFTKLDIEINIR